MGDVIKDFIKLAAAGFLALAIAIGGQFLAVEPPSDGTCGELWDLLGRIEAPSDAMVAAGDACARELLEDIDDR